MLALPSPGDVIASRFRIEAEVGRGAMGVVFRANDPSNPANGPVAVKVLLPEAIEAPDAVERFTNEARAARALTSDHAVRVFDAGTLDSGLPYMVMELLEGMDLSTVLEKNGRFAIPQACDAVIEACDALAEAHARGMIHRDLKPGNLFAARARDGRTRVKVLDFGLSKVAAEMRQVALTSTGTALGTPHYMAPEQLRSAKGADARADMWSLGVVLYELLSGQVPFDGRSFGMLFGQIISQDPQPVTVHRPEVPPALAEIVQRCLKKNRDERYPDLAALVAALVPFASPAGAAVARHVLDGRAPRPPQAQQGGKLKGTMLMAGTPQSVGRMAAATPATAHAPVPAAPAPQPLATPAQFPPAPAPITPAKPSRNVMAVVIACAVLGVLVVAGIVYVLLVRRA